LSQWTQLLFIGKQTPFVCIKSLRVSALYRSHYQAKPLWNYIKEKTYIT